MNYPAHRHRRCWERSRYCERPVRCDPPISWPHRPSPSFSNFPGISISWPMPMLFPMMVGGLGSVRWTSGEPIYADRSYAMDQSYEWRRYDRCCRRCGCYECRCERERCDGCGYYECRCERCAKCGRVDCCCEEYGGRCVEFHVELNGSKLNYAINIDRQYFDSDVLLKCSNLNGQNPGNTIIAPVIHREQNAVRIVIKLETPGGAAVNADTYSARIYDKDRPAKTLANLTLVLYP